MGKNYKWLMLGLLSLAFFFSQADRALFGLLTIPIQDELKLDDLQIGLANTVFFVVFAFAVPVAGFVGDRFSRKWVITLALMFWSLMTICTGLVGGLIGLIVFRSVFTSIGETFYCPSAYALISSHHKESRTLALAIHQSALYLGLVLCGALVMWTLKAVGGWRVVFWVFGGAGFLLSVSFIWLLKDEVGGGRAGGRWKVEGEEKVKGKGDRPTKEVASSSVSPLPSNLDLTTSQTSQTSLSATHHSSPKPHGSFRDGCLAFVRCPTLLMNAFGFIAINFANNAYVSWAPKFMARKFMPYYEQALSVDGSTQEGLKAIVASAGNGTMLYHHLCCFVAVMAAGFVTDHFIRKGFPRFRLALQSAAMMLGAPALVFLGFAPTIAACYGATIAYGIFRGTYEANTQTSAFDVVKPENRATVVAIADFAGMLVGSLSPLVIGALSNRYGIRGFEIGFSLMGGAYFFGACAMAYAALFTFKKDKIDE